MISLAIKFPSAALLRPVDIKVSLPFGVGKARPPHKVVWALHCAMATGDIFFDRLNADLAARDAGAALVAPSLGNGFFANTPWERQADFLEEMREALPEILPLSPDREDNAVLGISMGGFGAFRWVLASGAFHSATAISGVFDYRVEPDPAIKCDKNQKAIHTVFSRIMKERLMGVDGHPEEDCDLALLAKKCLHAPALWLYCGEEDYISRPQCGHMAEICKAHGLATETRLCPGGHDEAFWRKVLPEAIGNLFGNRPASE